MSTSNIPMILMCTSPQTSPLFACLPPSLLYSPPLSHLDRKIQSEDWDVIFFFQRQCRWQTSPWGMIGWKWRVGEREGGQLCSRSTLTVFVYGTGWEDEREGETETLGFTGELFSPSSRKSTVCADFNPTGRPHVFTPFTQTWYPVMIFCTVDNWYSLFFTLCCPRCLRVSVSWRKD